MIKSIAKKVIIRIQAISPALATKILYLYYFHRRLNLKNPDTLNAKMQYLKLNDYRNNEVVKKCVDKFLVRQYVIEKGCEDILIPLVSVYDNVSEINWKILPRRFVLKCNHGSGSVIICNNKDDLDIPDAKSKLKQWMSEDFGAERAELSYKGVPKKIICEELLSTKDGLPPKDYKIFCNYGKPLFLFVASERRGEHAYFDYFDLEWNHLPVKNGHPNAPYSISKPEKFDEMLKIASRLSEEFPLVRVDLYYENHKIYFGELTFLHFGGLHSFVPDEFDYKFGEMVHLYKMKGGA